MEIIRWRSDYSTQISAMDEEHKILIGLLNELFTALRQHTEKGVGQHVLTALIEYTETHFKHEEALMERYEYPHTDAHKHEHRMLLEQVHTYSRRLEAYPQLSIEMDLYGFLSNWLLLHITETDKRYGSYLKDKGL